MNLTTDLLILGSAYVIGSRLVHHVLRGSNNDRGIARKNRTDMAQKNEKVANRIRSKRKTNIDRLAG
jgi:hypothetical protein